MILRKFIKLILIPFALNSLAIAQDAKLDQLLVDKDLTTSLRLIDSMGMIAKQKDPSAGLYYLNKIVEVSKRSGNDTVIAKALWRKGKYLRKTGVLEEAESLLIEARNLFKKHNMPSWEVSALTDLGNVYNLKGLNDAALSRFFDAIKVAERSKKPDLIAPIYANMGNTYLQIGNHDKADEFYNKGLKFYKEKGDTLSVALTLDNLGLVQSQKGNYELALKYQLEAFKFIERTKENNFIAESSLNIAISYIELKDYTKAREFLLKAEEIYKKMDSKMGLAILSIDFGEIELKQKNYKEAVKYYEKGLVYAKEVDSYDLVKTLTINLSDCYDGMGEPAKAFKYYKLYTQVKDSIVNVESAKQINDLTEKYESKQKQAEIDLLTKDNLINETKIKQNKFITTALVLGILLTFIMLSAFYFRYRDKKKANLLLEEKNKVIEEKQKEIFDSLQYARQIQKLLLANHKLVNETLPDSFIVFKPKDIVSGDFYWAAKKEDRFYLAVCDSTGHGVPGAFMSLLNINFLNEAINEKNISEPNEVFNYVRKRLVDNLSQDGRQDGMDGILICVNEKSKKMTYAAANNTPFVIKNNALSVLGTDKMPIGKGEKNEPFKLYEFEMNKGDQLYLSTDGFADQFGGPKGKKYKYKPMYELILKNSNLPVLQQEELLYAEFERWKGSLEQVDDVCILGIRF